MFGRPATSARKTSNTRRWQTTLLIVALAVLSPLNAPATGACSIEADGETVYARVQEILTKKIF